MKKMRFIATVGAAAFILTIAAGAFVHRLNSAAASPQMQTGKMMDIGEIMKKMDVRTLPEESWPAI